MRMIDRIRKEGIKNGFQVTLSLLAARTKRAACWGDKSQPAEGRTPPPSNTRGCGRRPWSPLVAVGSGRRPWSALVAWVEHLAGLGGRGAHAWLPVPLRPREHAGGFWNFSWKAGDCNARRLLPEARSPGARVMTQCNENDPAPACGRTGGEGTFPG